MKSLWLKLLTIQPESTDESSRDIQMSHLGEVTVNNVLSVPTRTANEGRSRHGTQTKLFSEGNNIGRNSITINYDDSVNVEMNDALIAGHLQKNVVDMYHMTKGQEYLVKNDEIIAKNLTQNNNDITDITKGNIVMKNDELIGQNLQRNIMDMYDTTKGN